MPDLADLLGPPPPQPQQWVCAECLAIRRIIFMGLTNNGQAWNEMADDEKQQVIAQMNDSPAFPAETMIGGTAVCFNHLPTNSPASRLLIAQGGMPPHFPNGG